MNNLHRRTVIHHTHGQINGQHNKRIPKNIRILFSVTEQERSCSQLWSLTCWKLWSLYCYSLAFKAQYFFNHSCNIGCELESRYPFHPIRTMTTAVCVNCKPTKSVEEDKPLITKTGCTDDYALMQTCMDQNKGNIASCKAEWSQFRLCYSNRKKEAELWDPPIQLRFNLRTPWLERPRVLPQPPTTLNYFTNRLDYQE